MITLVPERCSLADVIEMLQGELEAVQIAPSPWATQVDRDRDCYATWSWPRFVGWILFRIDVAISEEFRLETIVSFLKVLAPEAVENIPVWREEPVDINLEAR